MHTFESKGGIERVGMIIGYLEGNNPGSAILYFPDPDCPSDPNWWWYSKQDRDHADPPIAKSIGSLAFPQGRCVRIELDYEDGHSAKRLTITDAQGIPFLSLPMQFYCIGGFSIL